SGPPRARTRSSWCAPGNVFSESEKAKPPCDATRELRMAALAKVFARISASAPSVSASDAQKSLLKAGGFGMFSLTGTMLKKGIEKALEKADANGDGRVDVDE